MFIIFPGYSYLSSTEHSMSDNCNTRIPRRPSKVDIREADELKYWTYKLGCTPEQLKTAVRLVGSNLTAVTSYFAEMRNHPPIRDVA